MDLMSALLLTTALFVARLGEWYLLLGRRFKGSYIPDADTWIFLIGARKIRENDFRLSGRYRDDDVPADRYYPPLFFYLLALIPERYARLAIKYGSAVTDAVVAALLFATAAFVSDSMFLGFLAAIVYLSSPMIFQQVFCLCVRPLTILLISIVFLISFSPSLLSVFALTALTSIILLLHKFATQVLAFTSIAFLFIGRIDVLASLALGFAVALAVSRGYYLNVLKAHINHLRSGYLRRFLSTKQSGLIKRTLALGVYCPWLLYCGLTIYGNRAFLASSPFVYVITWILTLTALAIVTNVGLLRILGEGWRYLGYLGFPVGFYVALTIGYDQIALAAFSVFVILGFVISDFYARRLFRTHEKYLFNEEDSVIFSDLSKMEGDKIAVYPKEFTYPVAYFSGKDYSTKLERDFDSVAIELANLVVVNKELSEAKQIEDIEKRGLRLRFQKDRWLVYAK